MEESEFFKPIAEHLVKCNEPVHECPTCRAVYGEERPKANIVARFEKAVAERRKRGRPVQASS